MTMNESTLSAQASAPPKQKEKVDFIDLMKALASYLVVIYHYNYIDIDIVRNGGALQYLNYYLTAFLPVAVPIFFFTNGALLLNKRSVDLKRHCFKILNFVVLVIVWACLSYIIISWLRAEPMHVRDLVHSVYYFKQGWTNHLWFLQGLTVVYIFFPVLYSAFHHQPSHLYFFFAVAMILTLGNTLIVNVTTVFSYFSGMLQGRDLHQNFFSGFNAFQGIYGYSLVFFILGGLLMRDRHRYDSKRLRIIAAVTLPVATGLQWLYALAASGREGAVIDIVWYGHDTVFSLMIVIALFVLVLPYTHRGWFGRIVAVTGQNTLGIYFLHVLVAEAISQWLFIVPGLSDFFSNALLALVLMGVTLALTLLLRTVPLLRNLVSLKA